MNGAFVADASVGVAWAVSSQSSAATDALLRDVALGRTFVVPGLWMFEVANSLIVLVRRRRINAGDCGLARRSIVRLRPIVDDDGPSLALGTVWDTAERYNLTVYDATYLELALRTSLPLVSRDGALNHAARLAGAKTLL